MSLLNAGREINRQHLISSENLYLGSVVNNDDPKRMQRIKVRIHDLHRQISDSQLPWCLPLVLLCGSNEEIGQLGPIPTLGSRVYVTFLDKSNYFPFYFGGTVSEDRKLAEFTSGELESDYPYVTGKIDRSGNRWVVNTNKDQIELVHVSGTRISVDGFGHVQIDVANNAVGENAERKHAAGLTLNIAGNLDINVSGNTHLKTQGYFRVDAGQTSSVVSRGPANLHSHSRIDIDTTGNIDLNTNQSPSGVNPPRSFPPESSPPRKRPKEEPISPDNLSY